MTNFKIEYILAAIFMGKQTGNMETKEESTK